MNILKLFFAPKKPQGSQRDIAAQKKAHNLTLQPSSSPTYTSDISRKKSSGTNLKKESNKIAQFDFQDAVLALPSRILDFNKVKVITSALGLDLGFLVGVINGHRMKEDLFAADTHQVRVGPEEEISCLSCLRQCAIDSLVVYWSKVDDQCKLQEVVERRQRVVFVVQTWKLMRTLISQLQKTLFERYQKKLAQVSNRLVCNIYSWKSQFVLQFQKKEVFANFIKQKIPALSTLEETLRLMTIITVQNYADIRQSGSSCVSLNSIINTLKEQIEKEETLKKLEAQLKEEEQKESRKRQTQNVNKYYEIVEQDDCQIEYFKRESHKETRESGRESGSRMANCSDLYYFIEEHISQEQSSYQPQEAEEGEVPESSRRLVRSNSEDLHFSFKEAELNDEFFTKY